MIKYRNKYILDGLDELSPEMERDLDLAYDVCIRIREGSDCKCCGKCCRQSHITVLDEEIDRISEYVGLDHERFVSDYLYREKDTWFFRKGDACAFLNSENKCNIWPGRPEICRDFPYMVSKLMSSVYLAIVYPEYGLDLSYMERDWPCTPYIRDNIYRLVEEAQDKRYQCLEM